MIYIYIFNRTHKCLDIYIALPSMVSRWLLVLAVCVLGQCHRRVFQGCGFLDGCDVMSFKMLHSMVGYLIPYHPWDWYIYLHLPWKSTIHVGKYTSPMDGMGMVLYVMIRCCMVYGMVSHGMVWFVCMYILSYRGHMGILWNTHPLRVATVPLDLSAAIG